MRRRQLLAAALIGLVPLPAFAQGAPTDASGFVSNFAQKGIVDVLEAKISQGEKTQRFRTLFNQLFDIPAIARFVLGRFWNTASESDQGKFLKVFEDVIVYTWARRFSEYNGQSLRVDGTTPDGAEGALVNSHIVGKDGGQSFGVAWRLRKPGGGWRIVDVIIDGVSMAITYRNEYASIISQQGGMPGLIAQLETRAKDLAKQQGVG